jgi:hypothetical protein
MNRLKFKFGVWLLVIGSRIADLDLDYDFEFDCDCGDFDDEYCCDYCFEEGNCQ